MVKLFNVLYQEALFIEFFIQRICWAKEIPNLWTFWNQKEKPSFLLSNIE